MGLPIWKPRFTDEELEELEAKESCTSKMSLRRRMPLNNNNNTIPISSSSFSNFGSLRRSRTSRRQSMLTSSLMDRRQSSRGHHNNQDTSPVRSELDRRLQQRIKEKEDVLEQLQVTVSLLDQFISARVALGSSATALPAFITRDLPAILQSATISVGLAPQPESSNTTIQEMVDRLLQIPPYSAQVYTVENNIISAYRRIREQLGLLDSSVIIPSPPLTHRSPPRTNDFPSSLSENDLSQI
ncbi:hypothetical protein K501DRAFT_334960 [Backusella circina FSU 941]|nr:hypothetical protein K501DRAFT_334960 [Backusella circina FSU 941]